MLDQILAELRAIRLGQTPFNQPTRPIEAGFLLTDLVDQFIADRRRHGKGNNGKGISSNTLTHYTTVSKQIKGFYAEYLTAEPLAECVDPDWFRSYSNWALHRHKPLKPSTVNQAFVLVKQSLRFGLATKRISQAPGLSVRIDNIPAPAPQPLTDEQLAKLETTAFAPTIRKTVDCFLFCVDTGFHFTDAKALKPGHVFTDQKTGLHYIQIARQKTGVLATVPISAKAQLLIDKYGGIDKLPFRDYASMWGHLKRAALIAELNIDLSMSMARDTFSEKASNEKLMSDESVAGMLGHTTTKNVRKYKRTNIRRISQEWKD